jgi:hypothetical protein
LRARRLTSTQQAAIAAFLSYYLVKVVPYWGLSVIATTVVFFAPLIYKHNQELIDSKVEQATVVVNRQTEQFRQVAAKHTATATELAQAKMGNVTAKAQQMLQGRKGTNGAAPAQSSVKDTDFPQAPKEDFKVDEPVASAKADEPLAA